MFPWASHYKLSELPKYDLIKSELLSIGNYAKENKRRSVTIVHKGNIMKFTEGYFKKWTYAHAEEHYADKVFTWAQYDSIQEEKGTEAANMAQ